jgi:hypothetical protein
MIPVHFQIPMANRKSWRRYLAQRTVELPAVPRVDDQVQISSDGWSEPVKAVWWDLDKQCVNVELGGRTSSNCVEFDADEDLRVVATAAGWEVS